MIGCGNRRVKKLTLDNNWEWGELVTLDHDPNCGADITHDLEELPWPVAADSFDEVHAYEVLEHLGSQGDAKSFFAHFGEIYRVLKPGGLLLATVPALVKRSGPSKATIATTQGEILSRAGMACSHKSIVGCTPPGLMP